MELHTVKTVMTTFIKIIIFLRIFSLPNYMLINIVSMLSGHCLTSSVGFIKTLFVEFFKIIANFFLQLFNIEIG